MWDVIRNFLSILFGGKINERHEYRSDFETAYNSLLNLTGLLQKQIDMQDEKIDEQYKRIEEVEDLKHIVIDLRHELKQCEEAFKVCQECVENSLKK